MGGPLFDTPSGQSPYGAVAAGGWHRADADLVEALQRVGVPTKRELDKADHAENAPIRIARW